MMYVNGQAVAPIGYATLGHNYSTDEQVVGTWIDGKPLYEKTIAIEKNTLSSGEHTYNHGIANVDLIFAENGFGKGSTGYNFPVPNPHGSWTQWGVGLYDITTTEFKMYFGSNLINRGVDYIYLTFAYTKTTDTGVNS